MQSRLTRSRTDSIIAGVCGGLGEYFGIDPIVVRLILVLITLQFFGLGIPIYILLWALMPKGNVDMSTEQPANHAQPSPQSANVSPRVASSAHYAHAGLHTQTPPPPEAYRFDPQTGQPIGNTTPAMGETINLGAGAFAHAVGASHASTNTNNKNMPPQATPNAKQPRQRSWRKIGMVLIGMGIILFLNQIGLSMGLMIPPLMIVAGIMLLRRGR